MEIAIRIAKEGVHLDDTALTASENQGQVGIQEGDTTTPPGVFVGIFDASGLLIDSTAGAPTGLKPPPGGTTVAEITLGSTSYAIHAMVGDGGVRVVAGSSLEPLAATLDRLARSLLLVGRRGSRVAGRVVVAGRPFPPACRLDDGRGRPDRGDRRRAAAASSAAAR